MRSVDLTGVTLAAEAGPPEWVHLVPIGDIDARDGRKFSLHDPDAVIHAFQSAKVDLPIDYEHQVDTKSGERSGPVPAAGWIKELAARADGLWGRVEWTGKASDLIRNREYRYISPSMLFHEKTREVVKLQGAGLVHRPALHLTALANQEDEMADETSFIRTVAKMLGMPEDTDPEALLTALQERDSSGEPDPTKYVPIAALEDLLKDRNEKTATMSEERAKAKVEDATRRGFLTPAMKPWATALCSQNESQFDEFLARSLPTYVNLTTSILPNHPPREDKTALQEPLAAAVCSQLGLKPGSLNN